MRLLAPRPGAAAAFAAAGRPDGETPWRNAGWCALDLELTGLHARKDEIIAIGAVPIEQGRVLLGQSLYTLVRTTKRSDPNAVVVHKLRVADLADAPTLDEAFDALLGLLTGRVPVFHTAHVERNFLKPLFTRRRLRLPPAADTEVLGRRWLRERTGETGEMRSWLPLSELASQLGQPAEVPHHALGDALTTAQAFIALAALLDARSPQTVGSLIAASAPPETAAGRRFG
jgi:DNA polymerase III subunit epsilon